MIPTVTGIYNGANRSPAGTAISSALATLRDPAGGFTYYNFEANDVLQYSTTTKQSPSMLLIALQTVFRSAKHLTPSILSLLLLTRLFQEPEVLHFQEPAICNVTLQVQMG